MGQGSTRYTWTYSDYARFPDDGNRYEVIDGEVLVTPAPTPMHQHVLGNLYIVLRGYAEEGGLGVILQDVDLLFASGQFLRPDLVFGPESSRECITNRGVEQPPGLVVEVLSPTSASIDRVKKPRRYGDFGVPEYWVVDPEERVVWVWRFAAGAKEPARVEERIGWQPAGAGEPLLIELEEVFRPM
jgi:Uma2 family endonuclease